MLITMQNSSKNNRLHQTDNYINDENYEDNDEWIQPSAHRYNQRQNSLSKNPNNLSREWGRQKRDSNNKHQQNNNNEWIYTN